MTCVGVIAHRKKSLGGGLPQLRRLLSERGIDDPVWYEVRKSQMAPEAAKRAVKDGADLVLLWGGDGTIQRSVDALAGFDVIVGIIPAAPPTSSLATSGSAARSTSAWNGPSPTNSR